MRGSPPHTTVPLPLPPPGLLQDAGFFDTTKTGEITSRLAADTTTVSDQICLNLNVMLRSATQVGPGRLGWGGQVGGLGRGGRVEQGQGAASM